MILSLVAVGEKYVEHCKPFISNFINGGWEVHVLTDQPHRFDGCKTETYHKKIFSYFDKLLFTLRLSEEHHEDVLYIDADWIHNISVDFPQNFKKSKNVLYYTSWPNGDTFENYKNDPYFSNLINYWDKNNFTYSNLKTIMEWIIYIPHSDKIGDLIYDIEHIKPIFEYNSVITDTGYSGIGNGEGMALSYALNKNKIPIKKFDKI